MPDYVRVKQVETGHEFTVTRALAEQEDGLHIIANKTAVDMGGDPLPPKYKTTVAQAAEGKKAGSGHKATNEKES
ncbi:MAG TPA: hypothetical protein VFH66_06630 [Mycobacteriales bacterium]|nr:hypothetical protein [Mycobacteriales bacterium]